MQTLSFTAIPYFGVRLVKIRITCQSFPVNNVILITYFPKYLIGFSITFDIVSHNIYISIMKLVTIWRNIYVT